MATKLFVFVSILLCLMSCNNDRAKNTPQQTTPKALEENSISSFDVSLTRGRANLVESLYSELVNKNADLKILEEQINDLAKSRSDSTSSFVEFNNKNQSYYDPAKDYANGIKDSLLRNKMKTLIANSLIKYNTSIAKHNQLLAILNTKDTALADLHTVLKLVKTLPLMEQYQHDYLPSVKPIEGYIIKQEKAIRHADSLSKQ